jgi:ATP-dependent DNA helicase RecG
MRPQSLIQLFASVETLPGIAGRMAKAFGRLGIERVRDLVFHLPSGVNKYPLKSSVKSCIPGQTAALEVTVVEHVPKPSNRLPYKVVCVDSQGTTIDLIYFHAYQNTLTKQFPLNSRKLIAGTVETFMGQYQMPHPEKVWPVQQAAQWREVEPTYPLTAGISQGQTQKFVRLALDRIPTLPEWLSPDMLQSKGWTSWGKSLQQIHSPSQETDVDPTFPARQRMAFDELLSHQLALGLIRKQNRSLPGKARRATGELQAKVLAECGFILTGSQQQVLNEIGQDLSSPMRMTRLLQGDVGSGKTLVGLLAMVHVIEAGFQAALLVPTEVLAEQHYVSISQLTEAAGIRTALLTGRIKGKARQKIYDELLAGEIDIIIGTHALIQDTVNFKDLGMVVIDEQHRFGVEQRAKLTQKGDNVDILVMTATPIPRTLMLTSYGDLQVSKLTEKPAGRRDIQTNVMSLQKLSEVYEGLKRVLERGEKIYWVCPLVEESEVLDLAAATNRYEDLLKWFGNETVGLVHGQMKGPEKYTAMDTFKNGSTQILVSTTVIEVGVDVPEATVIIIEHAERFGLSQLHQLRGRVGRNDLPSSCLLLYGPAWSAMTKERFQVMRQTNDGFRIAEEDLRLRGGGDVLGTKQSGLPQYHFADLYFHYGLLREAHTTAEKILHESPDLSGVQGEALRTLLYLFDHDRTTPLLRAAA